MTSLLDVHGLTVGYNGVPVVHEVDLSVPEGALVTVVGANGAGKSTLLKTISGITRPMGGAIAFDGADATKWSSAKLAAAGIAHVPENRRVFPLHSVEDNLLLGGFVRRRNRRQVREDLVAVLDRFPILGERRAKAAGGLSGGEQQMLAIGMALMARPRLLILDEPSLGLAPLVVAQVYEHIAALHADGLTILLVEQLANLALNVADHGLVMQLGRVVLTGSAEELRRDENVRVAYL